MSELQIELIKKLGLSDEEINLYGVDFLLQYLKYHNTKVSTVFFLGFADHELTFFKARAHANGLVIKTKGFDVTIVCVNELYGDFRKLAKLKDEGVVVLNENEFSEIFKKRDYSINKNENIYITSIRDELRITKPLSNFDYVSKVKSFSSNSNSVFEINLYKGTCSCPDFRQNKRQEFQKGDLRRYCKHLIRNYYDCFNPKELFGIKRFLIQDARAIGRNFREITLPKVEKPIYLSYNLDDDEGCDVYFPNKNNIYERFSYNYKDEWFVYEDKPHGHVKDLRIELNKIFRPEKEFNKKQQLRKKEKQVNAEIDAKVDGCIWVIAIVIIIILMIFL